MKKSGKKEEEEGLEIFQTIENTRFNWSKTVGIKITKWWKGVKEEMNEGESGKKGEEGNETCETRESTRFDWSKTVVTKITKWWKGVKEEIDEGESE